MLIMEERMKMKKLLALIMAAAMVACLLAGCSNNKNDLATVEKGKLHMSTSADFPPYEMIADDGSFEGIDVEVAAAIAEKLGLELSWTTWTLTPPWLAGPERPERHRYAGRYCQ